MNNIKLKNQTPNLTFIYKENGFIALSQCPGKNFKSKDIIFKNNLLNDIQNFKS